MHVRQGTSPDSRRRSRYRRQLAALTVAGTVAAGLALVQPAVAAPAGHHGRPAAVVHSHATQIDVLVPPRHGSPGYRLEIDRAPFRVVTRSRGHEVLATTGGDSANAPVVFTTGGQTAHATAVSSSRWDGTTLTLKLATTDPGTTVTYRLTPQADRYRIQWQAPGATTAGGYYQLSSAGHWYGHGEAQSAAGGPYTDQPWPLDSGQVADNEMGPASYLMTDPFWFTSSGTGIWQNTTNVMQVGINSANSGLAKLFVTHTDSSDQTVFVESTPRAVYTDYIGIAGTPQKSDATPTQYREPLWNSWAQFYTSVSEDKILQYAHSIAGANLPGHTIQIDDGWATHYGDFTFNSKFPTPKAMSDEIHKLGFNLGLWVTLWINNDAVNYQYAADHGYLLENAQGGVCQVHWWNGTAGIVDLANPAARDWYNQQLHGLEQTYGVDGFKFDTRFFDDSCTPDAGYTANDYLKLGAQLVDQYDLQGAGVRLSWTGSQKYGFVTRTIDKGTGWNSLQAAVAQNLAVSTIGYPFVETDMIGGSLGNPPPTKDTLIRWAQAASLMPLMYSSTSPTGAPDNANGGYQPYDQQTVDLYRAAEKLHGRLAPYIDAQVQRAVKTGEPIMKPVFFDDPRAQWAYTTSDEWLLGDDLLAAPVLSDASSRTVRLPAGWWYDVNRHRVVRGSTTLTNYSAPLSVTPMFVRLGGHDSRALIAALRT